MDEKSPLQLARLQYKPRLPKQLEALKNLVADNLEAHSSSADTEALRALFLKTYDQPLILFRHGENGLFHQKKTVGVVFSGGQAAGGHNVIAGLFDALHSLHPESRLIGFLGGPAGIINNKSRTLTAEELTFYRNQGGFDLIGSGRTKIETDEQLKASLETVKALQLDALVVIGGDDSNTNAAILAEYFVNNGCETQVIGVPKTIDGDLQNEQIEISFGYDTACKVYSENIGNILIDCLSAKKYYHFIKLMGRTASHITLECALQTHPNMTFISEEVAEKKQTLDDLVKQIADMICERAKTGRNYGVILIPEGLIEFIPEVKQLIAEINALFNKNREYEDILTAVQQRIEYVYSQLSPAAKHCFQQLPKTLQHQLLLERDPHNNVQVSLIATEQLLITLVARELQERASGGLFKGSFNALAHFFGYEGRCSLPSNFDSNYCYALGHVAALLIHAGVTGYMAILKQLDRPVEEWQAFGVPLTMMMTLETKGGKLKPVIKKTLVNLKGDAFKHFQKERKRWALEDVYRSPGPIQFFGDRSLTDQLPLTMSFEK